jgi:hypothetical protein
MQQQHKNIAEALSCARIYLPVCLFSILKYVHTAVKQDFTMYF